MPERDFEEEFGKIMAAHFAAEDPELVDFYRSRMLGGADPGGREDEAFVHGLVRWEYPMEDHHMNIAVGKCVAKLAGIQTGREFFSG